TRQSQDPGRRAENSSLTGVSGPATGVARGWTGLLLPLEEAAPTEHLCELLLAAADTSFWLDSADAPTWLAQCSYMGTSAGPGERHLSYDIDDATTTIRTPEGEEHRHGSIFDLLDAEMKDPRAEP